LLQAFESKDAEFVCSLIVPISPKDVFDSDGANLSQETILNLLPYISQDFSNTTNMKLKWVQDCLMALDVPVNLLQRAKSELRSLALRLETYQLKLSSVDKSDPNLRTLKLVNLVLNSVLGNME
jgi:hypothetical protein